MTMNNTDMVYNVLDFRWLCIIIIIILCYRCDINHYLVIISILFVNIIDIVMLKSNHLKYLLYTQYMQYWNVKISHTNRGYRCEVSTLFVIKALVKINFALHSLYRTKLFSRENLNVSLFKQIERSASVKNTENNGNYYNE